MGYLFGFIVLVIFTIFAIQQANKAAKEENSPAPQSEMTDTEGDESTEADNALGAKPIDMPKEKDSKIEALLDSVNTIKYCMIFFVVLQVLSIIGGIILMSQIGSLF